MVETDEEDVYAEAGGRATPEQMARKHVYALNGSSEFLDILREFLQQEAYNVTTTNFVPRSFETIESAQPDLLIIDLILGEEAGWDLLAQVRESASTRNIPVILVSISSQQLVKAKNAHRQFSADRYLLKPFDLDDLLILIDEMIGHA